MFGSLKVRIIGDPVLREKAKAVKAIGPVERMLIAALFETMESHKGVGLAAPQVGISEQIFIIDTGKDTLVVINPKILKSTGQEVMEEGCLSIPSTQVQVKRAKVIEVEFFDENDRRIRAKLTGLACRVFQHEYDHLQGKLIIDYLPAAEQKKVLKQIKDGSLASMKEMHDAANPRKI